MVNTFLPKPGFADSAMILDYKRLGKQRVETMQLLKANLGMTKGWRNHPAAVMWRGYEIALGYYGLAICREWTDRGYKDSCSVKITYLIQECMARGQNKYIDPPWLGDPAIHKSHQSNLLRKDPVFYGQYGWDVPDDLPYVWPTP